MLTVKGFNITLDRTKTLEFYGTEGLYPSKHVLLTAPFLIKLRRVHMHDTEGVSFKECLRGKFIPV